MVASLDRAIKRHRATWPGLERAAESAAEHNQPVNAAAQLKEDWALSTPTAQRLASHGSHLAHEKEKERRAWQKDDRDAAAAAMRRQASTGSGPSGSGPLQQQQAAGSGSAAAPLHGGGGA